MSHIWFKLANGLKASFWIPAPTLTEKNLPDQTSRVHLITGGYTGVGFEVASILYSHNATVWLAGRSATKGADAIDRLQTAHPDSKGSVHFLQVDLSDLTTIAPAVADFTRRNTSGKLHWLNNNAGVMVPPNGSKGAQGHDLQYVTNIYGPFLLTKLLLPTLRATAASGDTPSSGVRVSWAGSNATFLTFQEAGLAWNTDSAKGKGAQGADEREDLVYAFTSNQDAYLLSKSANWWLAQEFGRRFGDADGVMHNVRTFPQPLTKPRVHDVSIPH
jgi:retinol dehydrogenase 12